MKQLMFTERMYLACHRDLTATGVKSISPGILLVVIGLKRRLRRSRRRNHQLERYAMFTYNEVFWLNVTNLVLGLVTLACVLSIGYAAGDGKANLSYNREGTCR